MIPKKQAHKKTRLLQLFRICDKQTRYEYPSGASRKV